MALSADKVRSFEIGNINELVVDTGVTIYEGAFVFAKKADGTAVVGSPAVSTHAFAGIAKRGATAGNKVKLEKSGQVIAPVTGASAASVGQIVYASDDDTLTLTASTNVPVGQVVRHVTSTTCVVAFKDTAERDFAIA